MLHLTYSNRMEVLAAPLAERVGAAQRADPLTPVLIVVPNRAVEQFVRFRLAERLGVAANLKFSLMRRFLADLVTGADPRVRVLDKEALHLLLFGRLRDEGLLDEPGLEAVRAYLGRAGDPVERDLRALQLGGELARLFEEYSFSRRAMLRRWRREVTLAGTDLARAESWQRRLFLALFDERQCARIDPVAPPAPLAPGFGQLSLFEAPSPRSRWMMLIDAVFALRERLPLPPVVHLFGISYVAPAFAEVFALLAERTELCIYGLNPCLEFWEDVTTVGLRALREGDARRGEKLADEVSQSADPFGLDRPGDTPALRLWGRPGREFIRLLNEMCECRFASGFIDPLGQAPPTLLRRLQRDVLLRAPETAAAGPETPGPDDSIRILACPGIRREVEIVADEIWALIRRDEQAGDRADPLRFHEIAVMVTDADREAYLTHIESIFRERHDLPFNIIDRSLAGQSRVVEAIDRLLDLPLSDFNFEQVMAVLTHPAIGGARADELDRWRAWCAQLNIVFGADRRDLEGTYIDEDVFHWDQAARRLALGAFMTGERSGDVRVYETATGVWLPFETAPDAVADVGRLIALLRGLIADARACEAAEMSLTDWAIYLTRLVTTYVRTDAVADEIALSQCLGALERLRSADLEGQIVRFAVARDLARLGLRGLEGWRGQHQADGVVVSSLLPMRAIPFKAVFVLGLGEGQFPAAARNDPLDLRQARRQAGDVTPPERDRYLFLETLLAARDRLVLSYVARDAATGEAVEPSAVLRELQYILRGRVSEAGLRRMITRFPVNPFDAAYFDEDESVSGLSTVDLEARRARGVQRLRADLERHAGLAVPGELSALRQALDPATDQALSAVLKVADPPAESDAADRLRLPLAAIRRFLESPLQSWARYVLGLLDDEADAFESEADEPLDLDRREHLRLLREAFWAGAGEAEATRAAYVEGLRRRTLAGLAPVGLFAEIRRDRDLATLATWQQNLAAFDLGPLGEWQTIRLGAGSEFAPVDAALPPIRLDVPLAGGVVRPVELHGTLLPLSPDRRTSLRCLGANYPEEKHFLPGFFAAAALSAAGAPPGELVRALVTTTAEVNPARLERRYFVPPPQVARGWLTELLAELLGRRHTYRLPIEAVLRWKSDRERFPDAHLQVRPGDVTSDRYGPIGDPDEFALPDERDAYAMVDRRLGIWFYAGRGAQRAAWR